MMTPKMKTPAVATADVGDAGVKGGIDGRQCATPGTVVNGQGMHAYEDAKALIAQQHPDFTPAEYAAACREAARLAGV